MFCVLQVGHDVCVYDPTPLTVLFLGLRSNGSNNNNTKPISTNNNNIICLIVCLILWVLDYISSFYATTAGNNKHLSLCILPSQLLLYFSLSREAQWTLYRLCMDQEDEESLGNNPGTNRIETIPIFVKRCGLLHDWCNIIMHFPHNIVIVLPLWFIRHPSTCRDNNTKAKIAQTMMTKEEFVLPPPSIDCTGKAFTRRRRAINWAFFLLPLNTIQSHLVNR